MQQTGKEEGRGVEQGQRIVGKEGKEPGHKRGSEASFHSFFRCGLELKAALSIERLVVFHHTREASAVLSCWGEQEAERSVEAALSVTAAQWRSQSSTARFSSTATACRLCNRFVGVFALSWRVALWNLSLSLSPPLSLSAVKSASFCTSAFTCVRSTSISFL